ncbi:hypothetical protein NP493_457g05000 [Ridgeia piscesae]|uniref:Small acidic protein n=1 Tax=Ridgeia piscesae TaxID=27915 RepID=A0AAD9KZ64_RIDPI|nr:hypothetical protein NP493_457g05000 [Ridgeia piscesae]
MGADKKDHQGRFIIGDQEPGHGKSRDDVEKLTSDLEDQYTQGMEHRLSGKARSHTGLGFTAPTLDVVGEGSGRHGEDGKESSGDDKIKVHSSNDWEHADLGDDGRKQKFLKLMGAGKKEHHGQFVIGDHEPTQSAESTNVKKVEGDLEGQFLEGAEQKTPGSKGSRTGYGFPLQDSDATELTDRSKNDPVQSDTVSGSSPPRAPRPSLINFVKGSS